MAGRSRGRRRRLVGGGEEGERGGDLKEDEEEEGPATKSCDGAEEDDAEGMAWAKLSGPGHQDSIADAPGRCQSEGLKNGALTDDGDEEGRFRPQPLNPKFRSLPVEATKMG